MEFSNVKLVSDKAEKSAQEIEQDLLNKHEEENNPPANDDTPPADDVPPTNDDTPPAEDTPPTVEEPQYTEEGMLAFFNKKYGSDIKSMDELTASREQSPELPEDIAAYYKYRQETGRSMDDYVRLNRDFTAMDDDKIIREHLLATQKHLDSKDVEFMMEEFVVDEDLDETSAIRKKELSKKKAVADARSYFESEKEKYKAPLESSGSSISEEDLKALNEHKQYLLEANTYEEVEKRRAEWFTQKTDEVFGGEFKGFEFAVNDEKTVNFSPGDATELKSIQSDPSSFIKKFLNKEGLLEDAVGYHKALAVAIHSDKFAKHFYEQGLAEGAKGVVEDTKNINMTTRNVPESNTEGGTKFRAMDPSEGKGLKIKNNKK